MGKIKRLQTVFTRHFWASFFEKAKLSLQGTAQVLARWQYLLIAFVTMIIFATLFGILSVGSSEWNLLFSALPFMDKMSILCHAFMSTLQNATTATGFVVLLTVLLQGIVIALLVFTIKRQRRIQKERKAISDGASESALATVIATLGLGCSACGTSLIIPLVSFISSSAVFLGTVMTAVATLAVVLLLHSSWRMGYIAYMFTSIENSKKGVL